MGSVGSTQRKPQSNAISNYCRTIKKKRRKKITPISRSENAWLNSCSFPKGYCIPGFLLLVSSSWIKGKKMALYYHSEAADRQCDPMTGSTWQEAFLKGEHLHAALAGFLKGFFKVCTMASFKKFASSLPSIRKIFTISIFKISKKPRLSPLALTILGGRCSIS